ncbi:Protein CBG21562 [Caenorhabditis briggsae]|nr:Protein CBG21562 [Caenorhabditis briggsae]ULT93438.1 hypothetical protein L3Y34_003137 [Caenorhabditis briggsae]UMM26699.1 hypothetical protein L5515_010291 [Caenorhabditis briggsae]CAP38323.1 Protein CBG21562 [Caenorhabditis briggsae]
MFHYFLILLFPLVVVGQWGTPPPVVTDQQCQEEYDKILGCIRTPLFTKFDDIPLRDLNKTQELVNEITHVLDCSGFLNCNSSRILQSVFFNQRWISDHFHATLPECLTREAEWSLFNQCGALEDDFNCNRFNKSNLKCHTTELKKQPNCTWEHVKPYVRYYWAARSTCVMAHQWELEMDRHHIKVKRIGDLFNPLAFD